ncbi:hypothetical protein E3N88_18481 [Mikania micrantha]|uniref:DNA helicase Pif1-like 2B domain-containing protein n=1 Tax=Mikania micrantha TaxID=192012 RepID=A0A5N6NMZ6_9ASTR|nr:hypothetical protein E3N88_18481 [Mikania micrantha]
MSGDKTNNTTSTRLNAHEARKARKFYLDSKRLKLTQTCSNENQIQRTPLSDISNVYKPSNKSTSSNDARKARRLYLDGKKSQTRQQTFDEDISDCIDENVTPTFDRASISICSSLFTSTNTSTLSNNISLPKLSSGKRKLVSNGQNISPLRINDGTCDERNSDQQNVKDPFVGISKGSGYYLRSLFATMLLSNTLSRPDFVWENTWTYLSDGILYRQRKRMNYPDLEKTKEFANWLLQLGEGNLGGINDGDTTIEIPDDLLIGNTTDPLATLIQFVYPSILQEFKNPEYFRERAILAPKNEFVQEINDQLLSLFPEDGLPNHKLVLKVGVPVMLLRNIDQQNGLCNGTRLQIVSLGKRVIEAEIISGGTIGTRTFIPRINLIPSDNKVPFKFQRRQFPVSVCFAMSINKSQGQSLSRVGIYLKQPVFTHGQLYVALSRVKSKDGVKILILDKDGKPTNKTTNVVYKEIFRNL